jgi:hypothetical protein|nr:MAG TPA: hypothetical protein [Caudoviricetes sp.]
MKPQVDFFIPSYENEDEGMVLHFTSVNEIDSVIESLNEARAELEHQIEMKRIKNKERRKRRKERIELDKTIVRDRFEELYKDLSIPKMSEDLSKEYGIVFNLYNSLPECKLKSDLKPYAELSKALIDAMKND